MKVSSIIFFCCIVFFFFYSFLHVYDNVSEKDDRFSFVKQSFTSLNKNYDSQFVYKRVKTENRDEYLMKKFILENECTSDSDCMKTHKNSKCLGPLDARLSDRRYKNIKVNFKFGTKINFEIEKNFCFPVKKIFDKYDIPPCSSKYGGQMTITGNRFRKHVDDSDDEDEISLNKQNDDVDIENYRVETSVGDDATLKKKYSFAYECNCTDENIFKKRNVFDDCKLFVGCFGKKSKNVNTDKWSNYTEITCQCSPDEYFEKAIISKDGKCLKPPACTRKNFYARTEPWKLLNLPPHAFIPWDAIEESYAKKYFGNDYRVKHPIGLLNPCTFDVENGNVIPESKTSLVNFKKINGIVQCISESPEYITIKFDSDYLLQNNGARPNGIIGITKSDKQSELYDKYIVECNTLNRNTSGHYPPIKGHLVPVENLKQNIREKMKYLIRDVKEPFANHSFKPFLKNLIFYQYPNRDYDSFLYNLSEYKAKTFTNVFEDKRRKIWNPTDIHGFFELLSASPMNIYNPKVTDYYIGSMVYTIGNVPLEEIEKKSIKVQDVNMCVLYNNITAGSPNLPKIVKIEKKLLNEHDLITAAPIPFYLDSDGKIVYNTKCPTYSGSFVVDTRKKIISPIWPQYYENFKMKSFILKNNVYDNYESYVTEQNENTPIYSVVTHIKDQNFTYNTDDETIKKFDNFSITDFQTENSCAEVDFCKIREINRKIGCKKTTDNDGHIFYKEKGYVEFHF